MAGPPRRIVVADDDDMIRTIHVQSLRGFDWEAEVAPDGIEASAGVARIGKLSRMARPP
jgi:CheY-like chemotaxis protein